MLSIIIPAYNEADNIEQLVNHLQQYGQPCIKEIIISDGGSNDHTVQLAAAAGASVVHCPLKGRAAQMNYGASFATGDLLYFIHADTIPPSSFCTDITMAMQEGFEFGRYRTRFGSNNWILPLNAFFTRFDLFICYGGDQTFFITRQLFTAIGGFKDDMLIMEDYEIVTRAKKKAKYKIIQKDALVSTRKYDTNSWFKVQRANYRIVQMYKKGASQQEMVNKYKRWINYR